MDPLPPLNHGSTSPVTSYTFTGNVYNQTAFFGCSGRTSNGAVESHGHFSPPAYEQERASAPARGAASAAHPGQGCWPPRPATARAHGAPAAAAEAGGSDAAAEPQDHDDADCDSDSDNDIVIAAPASDVEPAKDPTPPVPLAV